VSAIPRVTLGLLAAGLAAVALVVDVRYYTSFGGDWVLAVLGLLIDGLAVTLPPVVCQAQGLLPRLTGWGIWAAAVLMSLLALSGWSSQLIGDSTQARAIEGTATDSLLSALQAAEGARKAITETRSVDTINASLRVHCGRECRRDLGIAKAAAQQRDELDGRIAELSGQLHHAKAVSSADTGAAFIGALLHIDPSKVASGRLLGLTLLPASSGLLLSLAFCGAAPPRREQERPIEDPSPALPPAVPEATPASTGVAAVSKSAEVERELRKDPGRSNYLIAEITGSSERLVRNIRIRIAGQGDAGVNRVDRKGKGRRVIDAEVVKR
jgi:hypothetical protein